MKNIGWQGKNEFTLGIQIKLTLVKENLVVCKSRVLSLFKFFQLRRTLGVFLFFDCAYP